MKVISETNSSDQESSNVIATAGHGGLKFWDLRYTWFNIGYIAYTTQSCSLYLLRDFMSSLMLASYGFPVVIHSVLYGICTRYQDLFTASIGYKTQSTNYFSMLS